jgi:hypothetical protein
MKVEINNLIEKIFKLREKGLSDEDIKEILELKVDVDRFISDFEREKDLMTVEQVVEKLKEELGEKKEKFNYHKVLRLVKSGELYAEPKQSNKQGLRIHKTEVEIFIDNRKLTLQEWQIRAKKAEARVSELELELIQLKKAQADKD